MKRRNMPSICSIAKQGVSAALSARWSGRAAGGHAQPVGLPSMGAASSAELSPMLERSLGEAIMSQGGATPPMSTIPS